MVMALEMWDWKPCLEDFKSQQADSKVPLWKIAALYSFTKPAPQKWEGLGVPSRRKKDYKDSLFFQDPESWNTFENKSWGS